MLLQCKLSVLSALALAVLVPALAVPAAAQHLRDNDPDLVAVRSHKLSMDEVDRYVGATAALKKLVDANPALKQNLNSGDRDRGKTLAQTAADWDLHFPQATAVLRSHGFSTREYLVTGMALISDMMYVGMKKKGYIKDYPANSITPENAAFVDQNYSKLEEVMKTVQSESAGEQ